MSAEEQVPEPPGNNRPATGGPSSSLLGRVESILKFVTAGLGLVAAIGLPAVSIQLARYDVPVSTAGYQDVLRAGILPAAVLVAVSAYCIAAGRILTRLGLREFLSMHSLILLPLLVPAYLLAVVGVLCLGLLYVWGLLWLLALALESLSSIQLSNRQLLITAAALIATGAVLALAFKLTERYWANRRGAFWDVLRNVLVRPQEQPAKAQATQESTDGVEAKEPDSKTSWLLGLIFLPFLVLLLYSIKGALHVWDPEVGELLTHGYVLLAALASGMIFAMFFAGVMLSNSAAPGMKGTRRQKRAVVAVAMVVYVLFALVYSTWGYPLLYAGLGGGRPQPIILWLKQDDSADDIRTVLKETKVSSTGTLKRVDHSFVLLSGADDLLLTDKPAGGGKALLVSRSRLMALSW